MHGMISSLLFLVILGAMPFFFSPDYLSACVLFVLPLLCVLNVFFVWIPTTTIL